MEKVFTDVDAAGGAGSSSWAATISSVPALIKETCSYPKTLRKLHPPSIPATKAEGEKVEGICTIFDENEACFAEHPVLFPLDQDMFSDAQALYELVKEHNVEGVCAEKSFSGAALRICPSNVRIVVYFTGETAASSLFASIGGKDDWSQSTVWQLPRTAKPGLSVRSLGTPGKPSIAWNGGSNLLPRLPRSLKGLLTP
jgi:hypothetical protein